jgi:hypothetical protein
LMVEETGVPGGNHRYVTRADNPFYKVQGTKRYKEQREIILDPLSTRNKERILDHLSTLQRTKTENFRPTPIWALFC